MKDVSVGMIRDFVSCKDEDLGAMAKRHELATPSARAIRNHWTSRLSGRCVQCNGFVKNEKCNRCGSKPSPVESTLAMLVKINPGSPLIRRQCFKCKQTFMYRTGFVLEKIKQFGSFVPANVCQKCKKPAEKKEPKKQAKKKKSRAKKKIVEKKLDPTFYAGDMPHKLRHTPFKVLEALKLQNA